MLNTDTTQLQKEIDLRGRIIEALVNSNQELRLNYARAVSFIRSKTDTYSPDEKEMLQKMLGSTAADLSKGITEHDLTLAEKNKGITNVDLPVAEKGNGITESRYSAAEKGNGTTEHSLSISEKSKGVTESSYSLAEKENGLTGLMYSIAENNKGITNMSYSISENVSPSSEPGYSIAGKGKGIATSVSSIPETISKENTSMSALRNHIRRHGKHKGRHSTTWATTDLLIHIYNGGNCGYPALRKVTQLSTGGLGKMLMRLTKRGLIRRTGLQKLELTAGALNLLGTAYTASAK